MNYLFFAVSVFLTFFLQGRISILGVSPDLTALLIFYVGLRYGETKGLLIGAVTGLLEDGLSGSLIGPHMLSKGIIGFSASFFISGGLFRWTPVLGAVAVALLTVTDNLIVFFSRTFFDKMPATISEAVFVTVMQAILNSPAGIFIGPRHVD